ncbi:MAG TPA: HAMP domain-containing protein, partial [Actinomycetota bacterium]
MTSGIATPLHFAVHLLAVFAALAVVLSILREPGRTPARLAAVAGFLSLGVGEAVHAGAFAGDLDAVPVLFRTAGYVLIAGSALLPVPTAAPAFLGISGAALPPALAAMAAAGLTLRRGSGGRYLMGGSLGLLAISEALLGGADGVAHVLRTLGWLGVGAAALSEAKRSIQLRFVTGFVAVLLLVVLVLSVAVTQVIDRNVSAGALTRLRGQARATLDQMQPLARQQARGLVLLVERLVDFEERELGLSDADVDDIVESVLPDVDFILFLDGQGLEFRRRGLGGGEVPEVAGSAVAQECLLNVADAASLDTLGATRLGLLGCDALRYKGELALVGVAGHRVDGQFLRQISPPGTLAVMFRGADPVPAAVAGSFPGIRVNQPMVSPQILRKVQERFLVGQATTERELRIGSRDYFAAFVPLTRTDTTVIGVLMVAEPAAVVGQTREAVSRVIFLVTLGVVLLALFLALLTARRITRPVLALTQAARRVQSGDLAAKADVTAQDEVGD